MELCKVSAATESPAQVSHGIKENSCPCLLYSYFLPFGLVDSFWTDVEGLEAELLLLQLALGHPETIAYYLIEEQQGQKRSPDDYISFVSLVADPRYCGISYLEKKEVRTLLREDPKFWAYRPLSDQMVRAAADDVRFLPYIYHKMMEKLNERSLWQLAVRDNLIVEGNTPEQEILSVLEIPPGKMGCIIGRKGSSILSIKESCNAEILIGGAKGPPDKVFIIGPVKEVRKAEAILRGRMLGNAF
ncbi:3'-5' exonuclease domain-containing protein [Actinidia rufa]|uniref:3'-5' exonuclease domain-containing protein n=1 Tax=Actinidia rufa TaxID=165716 RepID=A0A7J0FZW1_9ERIC|nr:3'-5' exonuclease domain-containing protein [Actinidia rufa]